MYLKWTLSSSVSPMAGRHMTKLRHVYIVTEGKQFTECRGEHVGVYAKTSLVRRRMSGDGYRWCRAEGLWLNERLGMWRESVRVPVVTE